MEQAAQTQGRERHSLTGSGSAIAQPQIERRNGSGGDHQPLNADAEKERLGQDALVPGPGLFPHDLISMGLQPQRNSGQRVRQQIDEQQMDCRKGHRQPQQGGVQYRQNSGGIAGEQELNGPLDVGIHVPAVFYRFHNGGEVVIRQHHTGGVLGNLRSRNAHGHADIRLLQSRSIIDTVTGHGYQIASLLPCPDNADLMLRGYPGIDADLRHKVPQLRIAHFVDDRTLHGFCTVLQNTDLPSDGRRRDLMVAGDHNRTDSGADALCHRSLGFLPRRIHHGDEAQKVQAVFIRQTDCRTVHAAAGEGQHTQAFVGKLLVDLLDFPPFLRRYDTAFQQYIHGALGDHQEAARQLMDGGHHLPVRIEGNLRQPGPVVSDDVLVKAVAFAQPYQCGFCGIADLVVTADGGIAA